MPISGIYIGAESKNVTISGNHILMPPEANCVSVSPVDIVPARKFSKPEYEPLMPWDVRGEGIYGNTP